jgi:hypothetical protein
MQLSLKALKIKERVNSSFSVILIIVAKKIQIS